MPLRVPRARSARDVAEDRADLALEVEETGSGAKNDRPGLQRLMEAARKGKLGAVLVWIGISLLFELYVNRLDSFERTYGALGAVLIFLTWLWLSNIVMLGGAEMNDVLDRRRIRLGRENQRHGARKETAKTAEAVKEAVNA